MDSQQPAQTVSPVQPSGKGYGKRPLWQWIAIYVVIGAVVYGLIYYFVIAKKGGYGGSGTTQSQPAY